MKNENMVSLPKVAADGITKILDIYLSGTNSPVQGRPRLGGPYFWLGWPEALLNDMSEVRVVDRWLANLVYKHLTPLKPRADKASDEMDEDGRFDITLDELIAVITACSLINSNANMKALLDGKVRPLDSQQKLGATVISMLASEVKNAAVGTLQIWRQAYPKVTSEFDYPPNGMFAPVGKVESKEYLAKMAEHESQKTVH